MSKLSHASKKRMNHQGRRVYTYHSNVSYHVSHINIMLPCIYQLCSHHDPSDSPVFIFILIHAQNRTIALVLIIYAYTQHLALLLYQLQLNELHFKALSTPSPTLSTPLLPPLKTSSLSLSSHTKPYHTRTHTPVTHLHMGITSTPLAHAFI